jgi:DNA-binding response OmpR family regulator
MRKILIVDDDPNIVSLVHELLAEEGFMSVHAGDLETAWATLLAEDPDAAIIDLWLHGRESGWELVDRIRYNEHFQNLPVVIVTASSAQELADRAHEVGAEAVAKPFTPAALIDRLRRAMSVAGRGPGTRAYDVVLLTSVFRIEGTLHVL